MLCKHFALCDDELRHDDGHCVPNCVIVKALVIVCYLVSEATNFVPGDGVEAVSYLGAALGLLLRQEP